MAITRGRVSLSLDDNLAHKFVRISVATRKATAKRGLQCWLRIRRRQVGSLRAATTELPGRLMNESEPPTSQVQWSFAAPSGLGVTLAAPNRDSAAAPQRRYRVDPT